MVNHTYRPGKGENVQPQQVKAGEIVPKTSKDIERELKDPYAKSKVSNFERQLLLRRDPESDTYIDEGDVGAIHFSLYSAELQRSEAAVLITRDLRDIKEKSARGKKEEFKDDGFSHTLKDLRMGAMDRDSRCGTCHLTIELCPGHFGYIPFAYPIYHPELYKMISAVLNITCFNCGTVAISGNIINKSVIQKTSGYRRLMALQNMEHIHYCKNDKCGAALNVVMPKKDQIMYKSKLDKKSTRFTPLSPERADGILKNITWEDSRLLGFKCPIDPDPLTAKKCGHPRNMMMHGMMVTPHIYRPQIITEDGSKENPFTVGYSHVVQQAVKLASHKRGAYGSVLTDSGLLETKRHLVSEVSKMIDSSSDPQNRQMSGRDASVKKVIQGKYGWFRAVMQGKGVDFSARSVASPNPHIRFDQVSIPRRWASTLTKPVRINSLNQKAMQIDLMNGKIRAIVKFGTVKQRWITDNIIHGITDEARDVRRVQVGDIVHRHLREGDIVLVNRQPTLHKGGMMGHEVVFWDNDTIGIALPSTAPYNADFDGDELNVHVPQDILGTAEASILTRPSANLLNSENEKALIAPVYDSLLGVTMMTEPYNGRLSWNIDKSPDTLRKIEILGVLETSPEQFGSTVPIDRAVFNDAIFQLSDTSQLETLESRLADNGVTAFTGRALFSSLLPANFFL